MKSQGGKSKATPSKSDLSLCSWDTFLFLFPPRSSILELITVILLTGVYGALEAYFYSSSETTTSAILVIVTVLLSSYSLFSQPIPESAIYPSSYDFSLFSYHY